MTKRELARIAGLPLEIQSEDEPFLRHLPQPAFDHILDAIRVWADTSRPPIRAARARVSRELVIELLVDADTEKALALWDDVSTAVGGVIDKLAQKQRSQFNARLGVHLLWGNDPWDVEPAAAI